jgi:hypothetical protein
MKLLGKVEALEKRRNFVEQPGDHRGAFHPWTTSEAIDWVNSLAGRLEGTGKVEEARMLRHVVSLAKKGRTIP